MEESKRKPIMIGVIVVCLAVAGAVTYMRSTGDSGLEEFKGQMVWVKCGNPDCGAEYEMDMIEYLEYLEEHEGEGALDEDEEEMVVPLPCEECGKLSVFRAEKCAKCGHVFFSGSVPNDFRDRCTECGYSKTEEDRRRYREGR